MHVAFEYECGIFFTTVSLKGSYYNNQRDWPRSDIIAPLFNNKYVSNIQVTDTEFPIFSPKKRNDFDFLYRLQSNAVNTLTTLSIQLLSKLEIYNETDK